MFNTHLHVYTWPGSIIVNDQLLIDSLNREHLFRHKLFTIASVAIRNCRSRKMSVVKQAIVKFLQSRRRQKPPVDHRARREDENCTRTIEGQPNRWCHHEDDQKEEFLRFDGRSKLLFTQLRWVCFSAFTYTATTVTSRFQSLATLIKGQEETTANRSHRRLLHGIWIRNVKQQQFILTQHRRRFHAFNGTTNDGRRGWRHAA